MNRILMLAAATFLVATLSGCGNSDVQLTTQSTTSDSYVFAAGKSVITFSAYSSRTLSVPISAIDLFVTLPQGMSVATVSGASGSIDPAAMTAGSVLAGTNLAFGTYSASTRKVRLSMATTSRSYRSGEFLRLTCDVTATPVITLGDLRALNFPVVQVTKAVGYDPSTLSTVVLTDSIKITIDAAQ
ncbi:hypothetical protein [Geotalea uraniireducens]|uniref:Uncharacterized protein n=1 Tax=Geotalea uraniireducens (strain Rf4) TaxID=351605 RepID=A5GAR9_GEOUR|nr:hypothetical protein [Geotalea uraniireducens]ABQ25322.1 hypothetical protein Gura_1117 [Geotalea uraniireducens Rf4]